jgi:hypothetical protein
MQMGLFPSGADSAGLNLCGDPRIQLAALALTRACPPQRRLAPQLHDTLLGSLAALCT